VEIPGGGSDDGVSWRIVDNVRGDIASHTLRATPQRVCDCAAVGRRAQLMWNRPGASVDEFGAETIV